MDRVERPRLRQRELLVLVGPAIAAVSDPVGPRRQDLAAPAVDPRRGGETVDNGAARGVVRPKSPTHADDHGGLVAMAELDLLTGRVRRHDRGGQSSANCK